eukprot:1157924-Pelagomonas_calceolata.AAC.1
MPAVWQDTCVLEPALHACSSAKTQACLCLHIMPASRLRRKHAHNAEMRNSAPVLAFCTCSLAETQACLEEGLKELQGLEQSRQESVARGQQLLQQVSGTRLAAAAAVSGLWLAATAAVIGSRPAAAAASTALH